MLPGWLWCLLMPLILVVGAGGVAALLLVVFAGTEAVVGTLFGRQLRTLDERSALRSERAALDRGKWAPLVRLGEGPVPLAARWAPVVRWARDGEVKRMSDGAWQVGVLADGAPLRFVHRSDVSGLEGRALQIGDRPPIDLASFVDTWGAAALREAARPSREAGYREPASVQAAFAAAAPLLGPGSILAPRADALSDVEALVAFAAPLLGVKSLPAASRPTLGEAYAAFVRRWQFDPAPTLADFADLFAEHATAAGWVALTDPEPGPSDDPDRALAPEPLTLYLADASAPRIVALTFREAEPWIVGDYADAAAFLIEGVLKSAIERELRVTLDATHRALRIDAPR